MKAAVLWELNKELEVRDDVGLTELGAGEVHVKLVSSGVCHSDLSAQNGTIPVATPCVLGHEGAGVIQEVGQGVTQVKAGDPVIVSITPACRECKNCLRGQSYLCDAMTVDLVEHEAEPEDEFASEGRLEDRLGGVALLVERVSVEGGAATVGSLGDVEDRPVEVDAGVTESACSMHEHGAKESVARLSDGSGMSTPNKAGGVLEVPLDLVAGGVQRLLDVSCIVG